MLRLALPSLAQNFGLRASQLRINCRSGVSGFSSLGVRQQRVLQFLFFLVPVLFFGLLGFLGVFFFGPPTLSRVFSFAVVVIVVVFELLGCDNQSSIVCCGRGKENDRVWILKESREGGGEEF